MRQIQWEQRIARRNQFFSDELFRDQALVLIHTVDSIEQNGILHISEGLAVFYLNFSVNTGDPLYSQRN